MSVDAFFLVNLTNGHTLSQIKIVPIARHNLSCGIPTRKQRKAQAAALQERQPSLSPGVFHTFARDAVWNPGFGPGETSPLHTSDVESGQEKVYFVHDEYVKTEIFSSLC